MTVQLDVRSTVSVDNSKAGPPLRETRTDIKNVGDAARDAAATTKQAGASIGQAMGQIAREAEASGRAQAAAASAAATQRAASAKSAAREEIEAARRAANAVIEEARRRNAEEQALARASASAMRQRQVGIGQLGMQLNDVAVMASMGARPMQIFASQANQVAFALSMMGGTAGRVGTILAGPLGAAITIGVAGLGLLATLSREAGQEGDFLAERFGEAGVRIRDEFVEPVEEAAAAIGSIVRDSLNFLAENAIIQLDMAARKLAWFRDFANQIAGAGTRAIDKVLLSGTAAGDSISILNPSQLAAEKERQRREAQQAAKDAQTRSELGGINAALGWGDLDTEKGRRELERRFEEGQRKRKQAADEAEREAKRAADAAIREAKRAADAQAKFVQEMVYVAREAARFNIFSTGIVDGAYEAAKRPRNDTLSEIVDRVDNKADLKKAWKDAGKAAVDELLSQADAVGERIGGAAGGALSSAVGVVQGLRSGNFSGVGGAAGAVLQYGANTLGQTQWFKQSVADPITKKLTEIFGERNFAKDLGETLQTAGFGASVGTLVGGNNTGSQIGGAIGSVVGKELGSSIGSSITGALGSAMGPIGSIVGSIAGSLLGGLFSSAKTGSATVSIANGDASVTGTKGNNDNLKRATATTANTVISSLVDIASALGGDLGNAKVSISAKNDKYYVDYAGLGRNKKKNGQVIETTSADEAMALAMANAISDGAITNVSARVQQALKKYADNLNTAVAEALKIQDLEKVIADDKNPFASIFIDFEKEMKDRLRIAKDYGFDLVEVERINAEERAALLKETMESATSSIKDLLDDLKYGSRAEGSATEQLAALAVEQGRIQALIDGGATDQYDALAAVVQQAIDLSKEAYGTTGRYAGDRASGVSTLEAVLAQAAAQVQAASDAAYDGTALAELNTTADEQLTSLQAIESWLSQIYAGITAGGSATFDTSLYTRQYTQLA